MLLVIPAIDLVEEFCVRKNQDRFERETEYFDDPVKMAKLWRIQNAKALHIAGHDPGDSCRRNILRAICDAVDIPIQLQGGLATADTIESAFEAGVYRVIIEVDSEASLNLFCDSLERYGKRKVVAGVHCSDGKLISDPFDNAIDVAAVLEAAGCQRLVYTDMAEDGSLTEENFEAFERVLTTVNRMRVTAAGAISGYSDLMRFDAMKSRGLDSVVIGRALYENKFPCQQSWCWNYKDQIDLSRFSSARLASTD